MGLFSFLKKKEKLLEPLDLSILGTDVHSHFIPGIDDGAKTIEESLQMIEELENLGYKKIVTTPHVMSDFYKNTPEIILSGLEKVRTALKEKGSSIELFAAAEYNVDSDFEALIEQKKLLTFGDNYVLFELPFFTEPANMSKCVFKMQTLDYKPILAHVERYPFWHNNPDKLYELRDKNLLFQLNINSLTGFYGPEVKKMAEWMVDNNMVELLGTDCHHMGHIGLLKQAVRLPYFHKAAQFNLINKHL
jgi:protein-tyrosine phosphatase